MGLLLDVDLNRFKSFIRGSTGFYWTESSRAFILLKPVSNIEVARTIVMKTVPESDDAFRYRELYKDGAMFVKRFIFDGMDLSLPSLTNQETSGSFVIENKVEDDASA